MEDDEGRRGVLLDSALAARGARSLRYLRALMESLQIQSRVPDPELISPNTRGSDALLWPSLRCATRDVEGHWALVYSSRGEFFRVEVARLASGRASAYWYDPRTGHWWAEGEDREKRVPHERGIPTGPGAPPRTFVPPGEPADGNDWVLLLVVGGRL